MNESVDRRVLGAFRLVDAITGSPVEDSIAAAGDTLRLVRNRLGVYIVFRAPGMDDLTLQFLPTPASWPAPKPFEVSVKDERRRYLPRRAKVLLPRALTPASDPTSVMNPQDVALYPSPAGAVMPTWAVIHASVVRAGTDPPQGLPWAVVRVTRTSDGATLATGVADSQGEALLGIPGLAMQANSQGGGAVMQATVPVNLQAWFDTRVASMPPDWIPDPDVVLNNTADPALRTASKTAQAGAGQTLFPKFEITV